MLRMVDLTVCYALYIFESARGRKWGGKVNVNTGTFLSITSVRVYLKTCSHYDSSKL